MEKPATRTVEIRKKPMRKKFVRLKEGCQLYSIGLTKFQKLAKDANAIYKIDKVVLVNCDILDEYLEGFHVDQMYSY